MRNPRPKQIVLAFILTAGLAVWSASLALKRYAASILTELLAHEVQRSCACSFAVDEVQFSLLNLSAHAKNARILAEGQVKVVFPELKASFSLARVAQSIVLLKELSLSNGFADGVGPDSVAFKFVSYLSEPLPPEEERPGRWRIKLQRLLLHNSSFTAHLESALLSASQVSLVMQRNTENNSISIPT